jgi:hypothetical protein
MASIQHILEVVKGALRATDTEVLQDMVALELERVKVWDNCTKTFCAPGAEAAGIPHPSDITVEAIIDVIERSASLLQKNPVLLQAIESFTVAEPLAVAELALFEKCHIASGDNVYTSSAVLLYMLETLTLAMNDDTNFALALTNVWNQSALSGIAIETFSRVKFASVIGSFLPILEMRRVRDVEPSSNTCLSLPVNILEATLLDTYEGMHENSEAGKMLIGMAPPPRSTDFSQGTMLMNTDAAWNTLYVLWNMAFVCRFDSPSTFMKLLLPCILEPAVPGTKTSNEFVGNRIQSLLVHIMRKNALTSYKRWPVIGTAMRRHFGRYARLAALHMEKVATPPTTATKAISYAVLSLFKGFQQLESWHWSLGTLTKAVKWVTASLGAATLYQWYH